MSNQMVKQLNNAAMTLVKLNQKPFEKTFNSLFEDFFQSFPSGYAGNEWNNNGFIPANIRETAEGYHLDLVAPGMEKQDFKVNIDKNILTISAEKKTENKKEDEKMIRKEYSFRSFSRSFTLDDTIDATKIAAKYENGVLMLQLPKKEEVKLMPKEIAIQ
jgi:HSP20 family protein